MRRLIAAVALTVGLVAGMVGFAQPAAAHTDDYVNAVCDWVEVETWPYPQHHQIYQWANDAKHWWGSHQAYCGYDTFAEWTTEGVEDHCILVDLITGYRARFNNCR
jgi:hypothetical protein